MKCARRGNLALGDNDEKMVPKNGGGCGCRRFVLHGRSRGQWEDGI